MLFYISYFVLLNTFLYHTQQFMMILLIFIPLYIKYIHCSDMSYHERLYSTQMYMIFFE